MQRVSEFLAECGDTEYVQDVAKVLAFMGLSADDVVLFTTEDDDADWEAERGGYYDHLHLMDEATLVREEDEGAGGMRYRFFEHPTVGRFVWDTPSYDGAVDALWLPATVIR